MHGGILSTIVRVRFAAGDRVHLAGLGTGVVREARGGGRYAVEIKGRVVVASAADLEHADGERPSRKKLSGDGAELGEGAAPASRTAGVPTLDLHGRTTEEAIVLVQEFINQALLAGHGEVRIIHGRSGGKVKAAVHFSLRDIAAIAHFRLDPRNPGATIVTFA